MDERLASLVYTEGRVVTSKVLANALGIALGQAKGLLQTFAAAQADRLSVTFVLSGIDPDTKAVSVEVVDRPRLDASTARLRDCKVEVYAVAAQAPAAADAAAAPKDGRAGRDGLLYRDTGKCYMDALQGQAAAFLSLLQSKHSAPGCSAAGPAPCAALKWTALPDPAEADAGVKPRPPPPPPPATARLLASPAPPSTPTPAPPAPVDGPPPGSQAPAAKVAPKKGPAKPAPKGLGSLFARTPKAVSKPSEAAAAPTPTLADSDGPPATSQPESTPPTPEVTAASPPPPASSADAEPTEKPKAARPKAAKTAAAKPAAAAKKVAPKKAVAKKLKPDVDPAKQQLRASAVKADGGPRQDASELLDEESEKSEGEEDARQYEAEQRAEQRAREELERARQRQRAEAEAEAKARQTAEAAKRPRDEEATGAGKEAKRKPPPQQQRLPSKPAAAGGIAQFAQKGEGAKAAKRRRLVTKTVVNADGEFIQEDHWTDEEDEADPAGSQTAGSTPHSTPDQADPPALKKAKVEKAPVKDDEREQKKPTGASKSIVGFFKKK